MVFGWTRLARLATHDITAGWLAGRMAPSALYRLWSLVKLMKLRWLVL
jgi:hypothetical protein